MTEIHMTIEGISPLLMHRFTDADQLAATNGSRSSAAAADRGTPEEQAEQSLYTDDEGKIIMPMPNLMGALINAGRFFKVGKNKVSTLKSSLIPAAVFFNEPWYPLISKGGWSVDSRPVRIPSTGGRIIRYRPIFHDWGLKAEIVVDETEINVKLVRQIMDAAGSKVGLCDYRPETKGPFGRFSITKWEVK